jgi:hypothetical protein
VGISRDYPLKTRTSKQPIGEISGFEIILSHLLKYSRSKQGLRVVAMLPNFFGELFIRLPKWYRHTSRESLVPFAGYTNDYILDPYVVLSPTSGTT